MISGSIDHTAIAVRDMDEALGRYTRLLGAKLTLRSEIPEQRVEVAFLRLGDSQIELIRPTDDQSGVARFLSQRGEALHHVGIRVADIRSELSRLRSQGIELIDTEPRRVVHGRIAFIHPRGSGGVLIELVEPDSTHTPY